MDKRKQKKEFNRILLSTVDEFRMLEHGESVLAAVSGGPDSVALVLSLMFLKPFYNLEIGVAHLNHLLRGEDSFKDEAFVRDLSARLGLAFFCTQKDVKAFSKEHRLSEEEAGREARYEFFSRLSEVHGFTKIATGHNRNDNVELILMNLLRGAGPKGLSGIPPVRDNRYIRPLIRLSKSDILEFLNSQNQAFRTDASNMDTHYLRNDIRHELLPLLESKYNKGIMDGLDRLSRIMRQEEDYLDEEAKRQFESCIISSEEGQTGFISFSKKRLSMLHPAMKSRVIRRGIEKVKKDLRRISFDHMDDILGFCFNRDSGQSLDLPDRIRIYKNRNCLRIQKEENPLRDIGKEKKKERSR